MLTGTEIEINLVNGHDDGVFPEAELILKKEDFLPDEICGMLEKKPTDSRIVFRAPSPIWIFKRAATTCCAT